MLQTFIMQNPTADELHFLLSVRAEGQRRVGLGQTVTKEDVPGEAGPEVGAGSGPGGLRADLLRDHSDLGQLGGRKGPGGRCSWYMGLKCHTKGSW